MAIKLIISDVDGTLIGDDRKITEEIDTLATLLKKHDIQFSIASGRILSRIDELVDKLKITTPVIGCNGASARQGDTYLWNDFMDPMQLKKAVLLADAADMSIIFTDGVHEKVYRNNEWIQDLIDRYNRYDGIYQPTDQEWETLKVQKLLIVDQHRSGKMSTIFNELDQYQDAISYVSYEGHSADIMPTHCNKGYAIKRLAEALNLDLSEIMAIGDHNNDLEMIKLAGIGVAVGNATEELKNAADYVCEGSLAQGVIEAIKKFCINGGKNEGR